MIIFLFVLLAVVAALFAFTRVASVLIGHRHPPVGRFATVRGTRMHFVHVAAPSTSDLPPILFVHGASSNLRDQMLPLRPMFEGRAEMLFIDRPGFGWSARGPAGCNHTPSGQAETIAALLDHLGISRAIVVGHSFGGAIAAAFAVTQPGRVAGLVFLSPATHPWPGAQTSWYYRLTALPVVGVLFSELLALPGGLLQLDRAVTSVFAPQTMPENYARHAGIPLVLRPASFRANARDVEGLHRHVTQTAPRYRTIAAPAVVITGNRDTVVWAEIHSEGLARDIAGAELVWVDGLGHKPDWMAPDLVLAAVEKIAGQPRDLQAAARRVATRIAVRPGSETGSEPKSGPESALLTQ